MMSVACKRGVLQEVRICLTKDLRDFRSCPQVDRSGGYKASSGFSFSQGGAASGTAVAEPPQPPVAPTERTEVDGQPGVGDDASVPRDSERRGITNVVLPDSDTDAAGAEPAAGLVGRDSQARSEEADDARALEGEQLLEAVRGLSAEEQRLVRATLRLEGWV